MEIRHLGRTKTTLTPLGLGCVTFGREIDESTAFEIMDYAFDKGITFFDTAEGYGGGQSKANRKLLLNLDDQREVTTEISSSERIVGDWIQSRDCRQHITLCTKISTGGNRKNIHTALDGSMKRLKTEYVDVLKMHSYDDEVPLQETLEALSETMEDNRVRVLGCSNYSADQLQKALDISSLEGYHRFEVIQPPYNLISREIESELLPLCKKRNISVTTYSPLAAGFLTGKYKRDRHLIPGGSRFDIAPSHIDLYFNERNFKIMDALKRKSEELNTSVTRLAYAWSMSNPDITSVIVGARNTDHIDSALIAYHNGIDSRLRNEMSSWE